MVRAIQMLSICAILCAGGVFARAVALWLAPDEQLEKIRNQPGAIQVFRARISESGSHSAEISPLVVQAKALALYLDPPRVPERLSAAVQTSGPPVPAPVVRPAAASLRFRLHGTSYYPNEPKRSMALISEVGSSEGGERWVKEGAQLGHFVIHEIRRGMIVYRDGHRLHEMAVERGTSLPGIVRDIRLGPRQVSSAVDSTTATMLAPAGPNNVGTLGEN